MSCRRGCVAFVCLFGASLLMAQAGTAARSTESTPTTKPPVTWETTSIHAHDPSDGQSNWGETPRGVEMRGVDLRTLLSQAYAFDEPTLREDEIEGMPAWARTVRYDLIAHVATEDVPAWQKANDLSLQESLAHMVRHEPTPYMLMMRSLLEERFGLVAHEEMRQGPIYKLVVAKGGARLKPAADAAHGNVSWSAGLIKGTGVPTQVVATTLSVPLERHVVDATGLPGVFDFTLHFSPQNGEPNAEADQPDLFTAVREQLGLLLEASRGSVYLVVIDRLTPPTPN